MLKTLSLVALILTQISVKAVNAQAKRIPPQSSSDDDFPESTISTEGMQVISAELSERSCMIHIGVEYAKKSGIPLHLHIIEPRQPEGEDETYPLIMYVQGSAWFQQNTGFELAQLSRFARRGFVIAVRRISPFPGSPPSPPR